MDYQKAYHLATVIIRVKLGTASEEDRELLLGWLDKSEANRQTYKRVIRGEAIRERIRAEESFGQEKDLEEVRHSVVRKLIRKSRMRRIRLWGTVAAAACIGALVLNTIHIRKEEGERNAEVVSQLAENKVDPRVKLILQSGEQLNLEEGIPDKLELGGAVLTNRSGALTYKAVPGKKMLEEVMNKIITSVGGEYSFILSDGTRVWLNAESELEFPVDFVFRERVVKLNGEAYFEVAPNPERPFIVETGEMRTRVLGTSFNIQAYENESEVSTTLLSGKVEVSLADSEKPLILEPSTASFWKKGTDVLTKHQVDTEKVVAWRYGNFVFEEEDIEVVMRMLSRWYGVEFVFDRSRKEKYTFSGRIKKDEALSLTLELLSFAGGPEFRQEGNIIHVKEK